MSNITLDITLTTPLHHGAGNAGNTALLRTEEIVTADGGHATVPFISGNSLRHAIRAALAWHTVHTAGIPEGTLTKAAVDLLWTGGAITTTGAQVDLGMARRVEDVHPALGALGYAAQSDIVGSTVRVSPLLLVCSENTHRLPAGDWAPHTEKGAATYRGEEFGTRHDVASTPVDRYLQDVAETVGTTQMIYDIQVLKPGSRLAGQISLTPGATEAHRRVLGAALHLIAGDGTIWLGAKNAVGYGQARITGLPTDTAADLDWWTEYVTTHRDDAIQLIGDLSR